MPKSGPSRSLHKPKHSVIDDPGSISELILKIRVMGRTDLPKGVSGTVHVPGVGMVVVKKRGRTSPVSAGEVVINGKPVDRKKVLEALNGGRFRRIYGVEREGR